jgi:uncharacterized protein YkwD
MKKAITIILIGLSLVTNGQTKNTVVKDINNINYEFLNKLVLEKINFNRKLKRVDEMMWSDSLYNIAFDHTMLMKSENRMFHSTDARETCQSGHTFFEGMSYNKIAKYIVGNYKDSYRHWDALMDSRMNKAAVSTDIFEHSRKRTTKKFYNTINLSI